METVLHHIKPCVDVNEGLPIRTPRSIYPCGVIYPPSPPPWNTYWDIHVPSVFYVNVTFIHFKLAEALHTCRVKGVRARWPVSDTWLTNPWLLCGLRLPWNVYVPSKAAKVEYWTNGGPRHGQFAIRFQIYTDAPHVGEQTIIRNMELANITVVKEHFSRHDMRSDKAYLVILRELPSDTIEAELAAEDTAKCQNVAGLDGPFTNSPKLTSRSTSVKKFRYKTEAMYKYQRSSGFVVAFLVQWMKKRGCRSFFGGFKITYNRYSYPLWDGAVQFDSFKAEHNVKRTTFNTSLSVSILLDDCQYGNAKICIHLFNQAQNKAVKLTIKHLSLPALDTSNNCLYEGLAIYDYKRAVHEKRAWQIYQKMAMDEMISPIVHLCRKVRQIKDGKYLEDYITNTIVSSTSMIGQGEDINGGHILLVYYSYHMGQGGGKLTVTADSSDCPGFYVYCGSIPYSPYVFNGYRPYSIRYMADELTLPGWSNRSINMASSEGFVTYQKNQSLALTILSVYKCVTLQYHITEYWYPPLQECAVAVFHARNHGPNNLKISLTQRSEARVDCSKGVQLQNWRLENADGSAWTDSYAVSQCRAACHWISIEAMALTNTSISQLKIFKHNEISPAELSAIFLKETHTYMTPFFQTLNYSVILQKEALIGQFEYGTGHYRINHEQRVVNDDSLDNVTMAYTEWI